MEKVTFMSVQRSRLQAAFAVAHRCATNPNIHDTERKLFRVVAYELWKACGEGDTMPEDLPAALELLGDLKAQEARRG